MDGGRASTSSSEDPEDEVADESDEQRPLHGQAPAPQGTDGPSTAQPSLTPIQKRRRVTRACDECRRKKIKCDGMQPCTHCTVYSYGQYMARVWFNTLLNVRCNDGDRMHI